MNIYVDFFPTMGIIDSLYKDDPFIFRIFFNDSNNSSTGIVYKNQRNDYKHIGLVTIELDQRFLDFYMTNEHNSLYTNLDLRIVYYLNLNEKDNPFKFKYIRDTKYIFSKLEICSFYDYPFTDKTLNIACENDGNVKIKDSFFCLQHVPLSNLK